MLSLNSCVIYTDIYKVKRGDKLLVRAHSKGYLELIDKLVKKQKIYRSDVDKIGVATLKKQTKIPKSYITHEQIAERLETTTNGLKGDIYRYRNGKTIKNAIHSHGYKELLDKLVAGEAIVEDDLRKVDLKMLYRKKPITTTGLTVSQIAKVIKLNYYRLYEDLKAYRKGHLRSRAKLNRKYEVVLDNLAYGVAVEYEDIKELDFGDVILDKKPKKADIKNDSKAVSSILEEYDKWSKKDDCTNLNADSLTNGRLVL